MKIPGVSMKMSCVITAALLFFIVANPMTYKLVDSLVGSLVGRLVAPCGCPTTLGLIVHGLVFGLLWAYVVKA
jgi:hypothetical protein